MFLIFFIEYLKFALNHPFALIYGAKMNVIKRNHRGVALLMAMIFVAVFSVFAVSLATMSTNNLKISDNYRHANNALTNAQSGVEVIRYYLSEIRILGDVAASDRLSALAAKLQAKLLAAGATNIASTYNGATNTITIPSVTLSSGQTFSVVMRQVSDELIEVDVTGSYSGITKTVRTNFEFEDIGNMAFDYGVASKGPLAMSGQSEIEGFILAIEASTYIEGDVLSGDAFSIVNHASIAGDVSIANPYATYSVGDQAEVGGATGEDVHDHVHVGVDYIDFPTPNPSYFLPFATGEVLDTNTNWDNHATLNNCLVKANSNPTFTSDVTINGVLFIESPNIVSFAGKAVVNGIVVGDGDTDSVEDGNIHFSGQVICNDMTNLTDPQFDAIKQESGTFLMAPGFNIDFSGQDLNMNGAIAASGISFSGQAGGMVNGSLINYSQSPMLMSGQSELIFNRSGATSNPAGFVNDKIMTYRPDTYTELAM